VRVSTEHVGKTADEVSSYNQTIRNEAKCSICCHSDGKEKVGLQVVSETKCVDLESKVGVLVLVVSELSENASGRVFVRHSVGKEHDSLGAQVFGISLDRRVA
jgi:hypothetical protein